MTDTRGVGMEGAIGWLEQLLGAGLFEAGQREVNFYVVKSGKVEIVDESE